MDNKYLNKVLEKLENYRKIMQQIELLRYEIQHVGHVSPAEMIEVMTFQGRATNSNSTDIYTKDVPEIALSYSILLRSLIMKLLRTWCPNMLIFVRNRIGFCIT